MASIFQQFAQGAEQGQKMADRRLLQNQQALALQQEERQAIERRAALDAERNSEIVKKVMAEQPEFAGTLMKKFGTDKSGMESALDDAVMYRYWLEVDPSGKTGREFLLNRKEHIINRGTGNTFQTDQQIATLENEGVEVAKANIDSMINAFSGMGKGGSGKPKLGTYNPSDYTVKSWSEFAKNGDPSILERYGKGSKERQMELREEAQLIKEEKFQLSKQKAESDKAKNDLLSTQKKRDTARAKFLQIKEAENAISNINSLLSNDLDLIYGGAEWVLPDKLRSQKGKNMMARRDQVASTMSLMAADKLKGQGTITDPERAMLAEVASMLKNQDISAERAKAELERVKPIFEYFMTGDNKTQDGNSVNWSDL